MDLNRFEECSAAYGAERRRWPERDQHLYDRFAATPEGAAILAAAQRADLFLDAFEPAPPDPRHARRIAALGRPAWRRFGRPAAALAASALLGFAMGYAQAQGSIDGDFAGRLLMGPLSLQELGL